MIRQPRRRKMYDLSNPEFIPETRKAWKRAKRQDLPKGRSLRHVAKWRVKKKKREE